jgi:hypothetical protein
VKVSGYTIEIEKVEEQRGRPRTRNGS